jgi:TonB family protein
MNVLTTNVVLPKIVYIEVVYPELAEQLSIRGTTIVDVSLDDAGTVGTVAVEKSSGSHQLDQEAVWGVKGAKYEPETISGKRVAGKYSLRIDFGNQ